jgi:hypothetical protein
MIRYSSRTITNRSCRSQAKPRLTARASSFGTVHRFTTYLALAAFFFGIGTFTDLRNRIVAPPPAPGQAAKDSFVKTLDQYCKSFVDVRPSGAAGTG